MELEVGKVYRMKRYRTGWHPHVRRLIVEFPERAFGERHGQWVRWVRVDKIGNHRSGRIVSGPEPPATRRWFKEVMELDPDQSRPAYLTEQSSSATLPGQE